MRRAARQKTEPLTHSDHWACARRRPRPPRRAHRAPWEKSLSWSERGASARASTPFCAHGASQIFSGINFCAHVRISHFLSPTGHVWKQIRVDGIPGMQITAASIHHTSAGRGSDTSHPVPPQRTDSQAVRSRHCRAGSCRAGTRRCRASRGARPSGSTCPMGIHGIRFQAASQAVWRGACGLSSR